MMVDLFEQKFRARIFAMGTIPQAGRLLESSYEEMQGEIPIRTCRSTALSTFYLRC